MQIKLLVFDKQYLKHFNYKTISDWKKYLKPFYSVQIKLLVFDNQYWKQFNYVQIKLLVLELNIWNPLTMYQ